MAKLGGIQNLFRKSKAEITAFGGSSLLAALGIGLEHGGAALTHAGHHPFLAIAGAAMHAAGKAMQTVAVPAAGATFITMMVKVSKAFTATAACPKETAAAKAGQQAAQPRRRGHDSGHDKSWDGLGMA